MNPPKLLSNEYESIEIECDFQSSNVMGEDKNIKLKYYQILYKVRYFDKSFIINIYLILVNCIEYYLIIFNITFDAQIYEIIRRYS